MARSVADGQVSSLFSNGWAELPILGYSWDALFFKLFGDSLFALRLSSAVLGIASVGVVALLGRELFSWRAGLLAAALLTFSHVAIHFSRVGHHYVQAMFAVVVSIYLIVLALRYGSRMAAVGAGIMLSVDIQVYYAGRVAYVIAPLIIGYVLLVSDRNLLRPRLPTLAWLVGGWIVGVAPIGAAILGDWDAFTSRTRAVLVLGGLPDTQDHVRSIYGTQDAVSILRTQLWHIVQTFNFLGDGSLQYGSWHPMLDPLSAAVIPAAVAYAALRARRAGFAICAISLVGVVIVGGVLTIDAPFWPRLIVLPPIVALLIAGFLDALWQSLVRWRPLMLPASLALLALLAGVAWGNYNWYFNEYQPRVSQSYGLAAPMDIGNYLRAITDDPAVYGISDGALYMDHQAIQLLAPNIRTCTVLDGINIASCPPMPSRDRIFIIVPTRMQFIAQIEAAYPGGSLSTLKTYTLDHASLYVYRIRQRSVAGAKVTALARRGPAPHGSTS